MDKKTFVSRFLLAVVCLTSISIPVASIAWFMGTQAGTKDKTIGGEVGLRSYFYAGDGSVSDPYEIVYPVHFYNLSRLQNLGVFSGETYFQIGHDFDGVGLACINDPENLDEHDEPVKTKYLDMKSVCYGARAINVLPIGNEGTPFVGSFEGNGIPIKNLKVTGSPEDIGVFGYVDYRGSINGLVLDGTVSDNGTPLDTSDDDFGVEICSSGYTTTDNSEFQLFSADIDDIFSSAHYFADAHLDMYNYTYDEGVWSWTDEEDAVSLKIANGARGTALSNLNGYTKYKTEIVEGEEIDYYDINHTTGDVYNKAVFKVVTPSTAGRPFSYTITTSSDLVKESEEFDLDGDGKKDKTIVIDMTRLKNSSDFQSGAKQAEARLSIIATTQVDSYKFSRVIQSYVFEFYSNGGAYDLAEGVYDGAFTCNVYLDYSVSPAGSTASDYVTNYHHGNNIGVLVGHLNGSLTNSYAYNPRMSFNKTGYTAILTESDTGLVGEIGKNVVNDLDPEMGISSDAPIGTMNFTSIYKDIRKDANSEQSHTLRGSSVLTGGDNEINYISYKDFINNENYSFWDDYLRMDNEAGLDPHQPIIKTNIDMGSNSYTIEQGAAVPDDLNKVDFLWNRIIESDTQEHNLGVFKIITSKYDLPEDYDDSDYGNYMLENIGQSVIYNSSNAKDKVYFSTAEFDHTYGDDGSRWNNTPPLRAVDIPVEYANDISSFEYPFSRDFDYVFQLDLSEMSLAGSNFYMSNAKDDFLINYLSTKIINEIGKPVTSGPTFGFMFARKTDGVLERPTSFSSYMEVGVPNFDLKFKPEGSEYYYPPKCIAFSIENTFGGNVSVVGNGNDITIYRVDRTQEAKNNLVDKPLYSMRSTNVSGNSSTDKHRYFPFHVSTGYFDPVDINESMNSDNGALYGHIFKLPQGDYVIGARKDTARIYFLAVQGQEKGEIDTTTFADLGYKVENVDFLTEAPTYENYVAYVADPTSEALSRAGISFSADFNETEGRTFYITTKDYNGDPALWIDFVDGGATFVTYLVTYSENSSPLYIQDNETPYQQVSVPYRSINSGG